MGAVESLNILHFDGLLLRKAYKVLDEKILKSYVSWHWRVMSHDTEELFLMTLKSDAKLEERLLVPKMTWGIWWILMRAVACLKFALWCATFVENICFSQKKYRGVMCHNTEEWSKIWRGTDLCFQKWREEFGEFWRNTQNLHFNGVLLTKVHNVWAKKVRRSYESLYWGSMQTLKEKWLVVL